MLETRKDIEWYEWYYQISSLGRVKALKNKFNEKILKYRNLKNWYLTVTLCVDYKKKDFLVHRLVAKTFIKNLENKKTVNHKDWNKKNNVTKNLERMTLSENLLHSYNKLSRRSGLTNKKWILCKNSIPILQIQNWKVLRKFYWAREAWRLTWIRCTNITSCLKWKLKTAWGYCRKYL